MKTISKVVIYYTDGTYQEVGNTYAVPGTNPGWDKVNPINPMNPVPYMPQTFPPNWVSPFTFTQPNYQTWGINEAQCGTGWGTANVNNAAGTDTKTHNAGTGGKKQTKRVSSYFYAMGV